MTISLELETGSEYNGIRWIDNRPASEDSSMGYWAHHDSLGEFIIFNYFEYAYDLADYSDYQGLGYFGEAANLLPITGTAVYSGPMLLLPGELSHPYPYEQSMIMWVNFKNGTALGFIDNYYHNHYHGDNNYYDGTGYGENRYFDGGLFLGRIEGNELTDIHFFNMGKYGEERIFHQLAGGIGNFYGSAYQGFGWGDTGSSVWLSGESLADFSFLTAGFRGTEEFSSAAADQEWQGYFAGMVLDADGNIYHRLNGSASDFLLDLNKNNNGAVGGSFNLGEVAVSIGSYAELANAFVADSWFFALLSAGDDTALFEGALSAANPWEQWSEHFTWGWWELTYKDTLSTYSSPAWENYWIAGNPTADLANKLAVLQQNSITGTYRGQARAGLYESWGEGYGGYYSEIFGTSKITVDFADISFDGIMDFSYYGGPSLVFSGFVDGNGIQADYFEINEQGITDYSLFGTFYGNNLEALAGNFHAYYGLDNVNLITGIFGGDEESSSVPVEVEGRYLGMINTYNYSDGSTDNQLWKGTISGDVEWGIFSGTAETSDLMEGAKSFPLVFFSPDKGPSPAQFGAVDGWYFGGGHGGNYYGPHKRTVNLLNEDHSFDYLTFRSSNIDEFSYFFQSHGYFYSEGSYDGHLSEAGFMGVASETVPAAGISYYFGESLLGARFLDGEMELLHVDPSWWEMGANWENRKAVGIIDSYGGSVYFFGTIGETGLLTDVVMVGSMSGGDSTYGLTGTGTFGQFYGSNHQGFGATAEGALHDLANAGSAPGTWDAILAGFGYYKEKTLSTEVANWEGFVVGLAENTGQVFMNSNLDSSAFQMNIDRGAGTISGTLSLTAAMDESLVIEGIQIGGDHGSGYVNDDLLLALMDCSGCLENNTAGYLATNPGLQDDFDGINYISWGYWATTLDTNQGEELYHIHGPGSMWVAGERTLEDDVQTLINDTRNITGNYSGTVRAFHDIQGHLWGTTSLSVNFGPQTVTGGFSFNNGTDLEFSGAAGSVTASGFTAGIIGDSSSQLSGAFFGPRAEAVGGAFHATFIEEGTYTGVFGARLVDGPLP